ncbi:MAG: methylenetetrahydrofolate reductase [Ferrimicrobium sp.]
MFDLRTIGWRPKPIFSVEVWPARNEGQEQRLNEVFAALAGAPPDFVTVTYGAAGSSRVRTFEVVQRMVADGHCVLAHLTCRGHPRSELEDLVDQLRIVGAAGVLALRGDPPLDALDGVQEGDSGELDYAIELVRLIKRRTSLPVAVAAHPAGHPEAVSPLDDLTHLVEKLQESTFAITQFYFEAEEYRRLVQRVRERGVSTPIVPGIMVPTSLRMLERMGSMAGVAIPGHVRLRLASQTLSPREFQQESLAMAIELGEAALSDGAPGVHLFSMNSPRVIADFGAHFKH